MATVSALADARQVPGSQKTRLWRLVGYPRLSAGLVLLALLLLSAVLAPLLAPFDPVKPRFDATLQPPSASHVLGTDQLGRDVLSRILYGGLPSLGVAFATIVLSTVIGVSLGLLAGYLSTFVSGLIMRVMDALLAFPALVLALAITFVLGPSTSSVLIALTVVSVPNFVRLVRGEVLKLLHRGFVDSCRVSGASPVRVMGLHLLPNVTEVVIVQAVLTGGQAIFTAASLSFLGLGLPPPAPSWGGMLKDGYAYLQVLPLQALVPGFLVFLAMLSFNLIGDGLRDVFDPRVRPWRGRRRRSAPQTSEVAHAD